MENEPLLPMDIPEDIPPRPTKNDPECIIAAAKITAKTILEGPLWDIRNYPDILNKIAEEIVEVAKYETDGYKMAYTLERDHYWECDFVIAEILDVHSFTLDKVVKQYQDEWDAKFGEKAK